MNDNKNIVPEKSVRQFSIDDLSASQYALKLALQTMKERCQKLQKRLTCLEDENLQLRIERHSVPALVKKEPKSDISTLQKQVEELNRQKSLLCHHIYMVATENKDLWERLSKVTDEKDMLDINLQALAENSNKPLRKPEKSCNIVEACQNQGGAKEDSLEEISLRILASLKKCKPDDGTSEADGMTSELVVRECGFTLEMEDEEEEDEVDTGLYEALMADVNRVLEKLKGEKVLLKQQQEGLKAAIDIVSNNLKERLACKNCAKLQVELDNERTSKTAAPSNNNNNKEEEVDSSQRPEPNFNISKSKESAFEDRICPLCTKFYPKSTPFDEFNEHVLSHFVEEPEPDSLMSTYELIT